MMNNEKYIQIFKDTFDVSEDMLNEEFTFASQEIWDSFAHLTLIAALEDEFGVIFETDDMLHFGSFENGKKILARYGVEF